MITDMAGLSALAMAVPAARAEDSKEANPEVEKIRALLKAHDEPCQGRDGMPDRKGCDPGHRPWRDLDWPRGYPSGLRAFFRKASTKESRILNISLRLTA
jgi:hypothetical protein